MAGFSTMVPLYILKSGGNVLEASSLSALMNLVIIPSSLFWGSITDRTANRQILFAFTYVGTAIVLFAGVTFVLSRARGAQRTNDLGVISDQWIAQHRATSHDPSR